MTKQQQRKPRLTTLDTDTLHVDAHAQRSYDPKHAKRIADAWIPGKLGILKGSRRGDGLVYVTDGQHRLGAIRLRQDAGLPAPDEVSILVYENLSVAEEAEQFVADNFENRRPNPIDVFRLQVVARDKEAVAIQGVLDNHGLVMQYGGGNNQIASVGSLRWLYREGGAELVDIVLGLVEDIWPQDHTRNDGSIIKGMGWLLVKGQRRGMDVDSLVDKLAKSGKPGNLLGNARSYRVATKRPLWAEVAHVMLEVYNARRTTGRISL